MSGPVEFRKHPAAGAARHGKAVERSQLSWAYPFATSAFESKLRRNPGTTDVIVGLMRRVPHGLLPAMLSTLPSTVEPAVSTLLPIQPTDIGSALSYARVAARTRSQRLWCGQSLGIETHQVCAALAVMTPGLEFGSSVALTPLMHPVAAATHARSVATLSGTRYIAGIGPGAIGFQRAMRGEPYSSPLASLEQYVRIMRGLLDDRTVEVTEGDWHCTGIELPQWDLPPVEIGLGVLRTGMARLAGQLADWAITWLTPLHYIRDVLRPVMTDAATDAWRPAPQIAAVMHCAISKPTRDPYEIAYHSAGKHLSTPHYTDMLRIAGIDVRPSDPHTGARALVDAGVFVTGSADDIATAIDGYHRAGVSDVIVNVLGVRMAEGPGAALTELSAILSAAEQTR